MVSKLLPRFAPRREIDEIFRTGESNSEVSKLLPRFAPRRVLSPEKRFVAMRLEITAAVCTTARYDIPVPTLNKWVSKLLPGEPSRKQQLLVVFRLARRSVYANAVSIRYACTTATYLDEGQTRGRFIASQQIIRGQTRFVPRFAPRRDTTFPCRH